MALKEMERQLAMVGNNNLCTPNVRTQPLLNPGYNHPNKRVVVTGELKVPKANPLAILARTLRALELHALSQPPTGQYASVLVAYIPCKLSCLYWACMILCVGTTVCAMWGFLFLCNMVQGQPDISP